RYVEDGARHGRGLREGRSAEGDDDSGDHQPGEHLAHTGSFAKRLKIRSLIRLGRGYCQCSLRQVVIVRHGAPDVLQTRELADPVPGAGEIRIAVYAAGVNFADILARLGLYPDAPKPPVVVGYEVSGIVDAVASGGTTHR